MSVITNIETAPGLNKKKLRSKKEWEELVREFQRSGIPISRFCKQKNISKSSLYYWLNMKNEEKAVDVGNSAMSFSRVVAQESQDKGCSIATHLNNTHDIHLSLPSGIGIKLPTHYDARSLVNLIRELQSC